MRTGTMFPRFGKSAERNACTVRIPFDAHGANPRNADLALVGHYVQWRVHARHERLSCPLIGKAE
jgi:hypothetical protein